MNSAGVLIPGNVELMDPADLERRMGVNLYGTVRQPAGSGRRCAPDPGNIVNIASRPHAGRPRVTAARRVLCDRFAVRSVYTEALRVELYGGGIAASLIMPGIAGHADGPGEQQQEAGCRATIIAMPLQWVAGAVIASVVHKSGRG